MGIGIEPIASVGYAIEDFGYDFKQTLGNIPLVGGLLAGTIGNITQFAGHLIGGTVANIFGSERQHEARQLDHYYEGRVALSHQEVQDLQYKIGSRGNQHMLEHPEMMQGAPGYGPQQGGYYPPQQQQGGGIDAGQVALALGALAAGGYVLANREDLGAAVNRDVGKVRDLISGGQDVSQEEVAAGSSPNAATRETSRQI